MWLAFRAEWLKITGNRWLTGCLIWIWPISVAIIVSFLLFLVILFPDQRSGFADNPTTWTNTSLFFWLIPNSVIGRLLIIGFSAAIFAGEYQWGTWKNIMPRRGRISLVLIKFFTMSVFVTAAFVITSILWVVGIGFVQLLAGGSYGPALNDIPSNYWAQIGLQIWVAFLSTMIIASLAALFALVTRSVLASVMLGVGTMLVDGFLAAGLLIFYAFTDVRFWPNLYRYSFTYNANNLLTWANDGRPAPVLGGAQAEGNEIFEFLVIDPPIVGNSWEASILLLLLWLGTVMSLALISFYRQDLTT